MTEIKIKNKNKQIIEKRIYLPLEIGININKKLIGIHLVIPLTKTEKMAIPLNFWTKERKTDKWEKDNLEDPEMILLSLTDLLKEYFLKKDKNIKAKYVNE